MAIVPISEDVPISQFTLELYHTLLAIGKCTLKRAKLDFESEEIWEIVQIILFHEISLLNPSLYTYFNVNLHLMNFGY